MFSWKTFRLSSPQCVAGIPLAFPVRGRKRWIPAPRFRGDKLRGNDGTRLHGPRPRPPNPNFTRQCLTDGTYVFTEKLPSPLCVKEGNPAHLAHALGETSSVARRLAGVVCSSLHTPPNLHLILELPHFFLVVEPGCVVPDGEVEEVVDLQVVGARGFSGLGPQFFTWAASNVMAW